MRFDNGRESDNVEDRRRTGFGGGGRRVGRGKIGIGTIVLALVAMYFGVDPSVVLNSGIGIGTGGGVAVNAPAQPIPANDAQARFVSMVLADTEDTWHALFRQGGQRYVAPKLVLFTGATQTACGNKTWTCHWETLEP